MVFLIRSYIKPISTQSLYLFLCLMCLSNTTIKIIKSKLRVIKKLCSQKGAYTIVPQFVYKEAVIWPSHSLSQLILKRTNPQNEWSKLNLGRKWAQRLGDISVLSCEDYYRELLNKSFTRPFEEF